MTIETSNSGGGWQFLLRSALESANEDQQYKLLDELGRLLLGVLLRKVPRGGARHSQFESYSTLEHEPDSDVRRKAFRGGKLPLDEDDEEEGDQTVLLRRFNEARDFVERGEATIALVRSNPKLLLNPAIGREIANWHGAVRAPLQPDGPPPELALHWLERFMAVLGGSRAEAEPVDESELLKELAAVEPSERGAAAIRLIEADTGFVLHPLVGLVIAEWHRVVRTEYRRERPGLDPLSVGDAREFLDRVARSFARSGPPGQGIPDAKELHLELVIAKRVVRGAEHWCRTTNKETGNWPSASQLEHASALSCAAAALLLNERHPACSEDDVRRRLAPVRAQNQVLAERYYVAPKTIEEWRRRNKQNTKKFKQALAQWREEQTPHRREEDD